jgi:chaperonin GroEL (HSP60 family)
LLTLRYAWFGQAGDGTTTATILSAAFVAEGMKIVAAGANPVQLTRGMDKTVKHLVKELAKLSKDVEDSELASVASVSAGGNDEASAAARLTRRPHRCSHRCCTKRSRCVAAVD